MYLFFHNFIISVTKPFPDTKLGFVYNVTKKSVTVDEVKDGGLLSNTNLKPGQEIVAINGTQLAGLSKAQIVSVLQSVTKDLYMEVSVPIQCTRDEVPTLFTERAKSPVPLWKWQMLYDSVTNAFTPANNTYKEMSEIFSTKMESYKRKQMIRGGVIGFGTESSHEGKTFSMLSQVSAASNTVNFLGTNVLCTANALLNSHGICAKFGFVSKEIPKISKSMKDNFILRTPSDIQFMIIEE